MEILNVILIVICVLIVLCLVLLCIAATNNRSAKTISENGSIIWKDRKHTFLGLPISFTVYSLSEDRMFINTGFFNSVENEVRLYRILDVQFRQTLGQKILGLGSIVLKTADKSMHNFTVISVCHARDVKELISANVEDQRKKNRILSRESIEYDQNDDAADDTDDDDADE